MRLVFLIVVCSSQNGQMMSCDSRIVWRNLQWIVGLIIVLQNNISMILTVCIQQIVAFVCPFVALLLQLFLVRQGSLVTIAHSHTSVIGSFSAWQGSHFEEELRGQMSPSPDNNACVEMSDH